MFIFFLQLYSGYFTHHVKKHLYGAEALLELIGYQFVEKSRMVLLGPPNLDDLTDTSLNALIAMCECQVGPRGNVLIYYMMDAF